MRPPSLPGRPARLPFTVRILLVVGAGAVFTSGLFLLPRIAQDPSYHNFADQRSLLGIPHCLNVVSNVPFAVVGALGIGLPLRRDAQGVQGRAERWAYLVLFVGIGLTALGSTYYHLHPDNDRLVWDRLPMSVAFMGLFAGILAERIGPRVGLALLPVLVAAGVGSVLYWHVTEGQGHGDLRFYLVVQFFPLLAYPLLVLLFPPRYTRTLDLFVALGCYLLAKVCEAPLDGPIFACGHGVSGHTVKHLLAALGAFWIWRMVWLRQPLGSKEVETGTAAESIMAPETAAAEEESRPS